MHVLLDFLQLNALCWLGLWVYNRINTRLTATLPPAEPLTGDSPLVSVVVPARNEASRILVAALQSMLAQDWPRLEVVVVDDRSTDATPEILAGLAAQDGRLRVLRGEEPPPGWLGKPHAMHQGIAAARGEWILATDADMLFAPDLVTAAMQEAARRELDLLTLIPSDNSRVVATTLVMPIAAWMIFVVFPPRATGNPRDPRALGCGGFLLLRREVLEAVGDYAAVAGDVADDVGLAKVIKRRGGRLWCALAPDRLATPMYCSLGELWQGFGKNALRGVNDRLALAAGAVAAITLTSTLPPLLALGAWLVPGGQPVAVAALVATAAQMLAFAPVYRAFGVGPAMAVAAPWGFAVMSSVLAGAAWRRVAGRGTDWRGRTVP